MDFTNNFSKIKKNNFCNNCGKIGHLFHQCRTPIISNGIIIFRKNNNNIEILLVKRKDSLGFVDFIRGKYMLEDLEYIINLFNKMTNDEREWIKRYNIDYLWNYLWGNNIINQYKNEERLSKEKFDTLKSGYFIDKQYINIDYILSKCTENYIETEWGFPKGRRNYQENDIQCALREFEEETGYSHKSITIINNILPFEEIFTGSNNKSYKHKYFLAFMENNVEPKKPFQINEISKIEWCNLYKLNDKLRYYAYEKKNIINNLINLMTKYNIYL